MNYLKDCVQYFSRNILYWIIILGVAAVAMSLTMSPTAIVEFIINIDQIDVSSFSEIYKALIGVGWIKFGLNFASIIILAVSLSVMFGTVDRHLRIGEFDVTRIRKRVDYNFLAAIKIIVTMYIIYQIFILSTSVAVFCWSIVFSATAAMVLSIITIIILIFGVLIVVMLMLLWTPATLNMGMDGTRAFVFSVKNTIGSLYKYILTFLVPLIPLIVLMVINVIFDWNIAIIIDMLTFFILNVYYVIMMYIGFFEVMSLERADKKTIWKKR